MEAVNILSADVLDIIFDARNKEYGAYDLRKNYQRRLMKALASMLLVVVLLLITYLLVAAAKPKDMKLIVSCVLELQKVDPPAQKVVPPPPPPPPPSSVKMLDYTAPLIVKNNVDVVEMPEQDDLTNAKIGTVNTQGTDDMGVVGPPVETAKAVVDVPKKQDGDDGGFVPIEVESKYPGGMSAWSAFLNRNLNYPQDAIDNQVQGTVVVQFIVDAEGNISNITAISGPEELRSSAIVVIKKSGKWEPALQNGRHVKSYKKQPITFKFVE